MSALINSDAVPNNEAQSINSGKVKVTAEEWAAKARDKIECYHQVAHVFGAYVPDPDNITSWHLRDLCTGAKKMIKGTDVKHLHVPMYQHLALDDFLEFIS